MSQTFVKGALLLTIATFLSKVLGSVFRIPLQNIAGDEVLGIFSIVYPVYMTVLTISVAGIPIAISKLISEARVKKDETEVRNVFVTASILAFTLGCTSFIILFSFADYIAVVLGGTYATYSIMVVSFTLIIAPYMAVYRGFFQGYDIMNPTAYSQVLEQFVRVALILVAAYYLVAQQAPNDVVAAGVMIGSSIGALASLLYLRVTFTKSGLKPGASEKYSWSTFKTFAKRILVLSIPICVGALTMALLNLVDSVTVSNQLRAVGNSEADVAFLYGIYGRGLALVQIAVVFASALILPLIPLITGALAKNEIERTREITEKALKFTHLTAWPAAIGLLALSIPINLALFTDLEGNAVIAVLSFSALFTAFSVLTTGVLQGMNRPNQAAVIVMIAAGLKVVLNIILVRQFGLMGAAVSTLVTYIVLTSLNLWMMHRTIPFKVVKRDVFVFSGASLVMGAVNAAPLAFVDVSDWTRLTAFLYVCGMILVGAVIYGLLIVVGKGFSKQELEGLPLVGKLVGKRRKGV
ncbi:putative polysaccharide biosynthesis protein [Desertibacillus haloalkaliphilus]|uniref:putative polysaccharide biosynthesis protein n=1 Tax=Desertibacillus haloalkaliphilus TaxID=1328930 RepID=UPI001C27CAB8|nr:polysaccharide biosynthesis protein [Desertibacillus haloalkaliphilus]MBU8905971.1 polysaccharide biosynthesis protein [Desertibacillus haloalkaliphilus]